MKNSKINGKWALSACLGALIMASGCRKVEQPLSSETGRTEKGAGISTRTAAGDEFTIAVIGDTQNFVDNHADDNNFSGDCQTETPFQSMISWLVANKTTENIKLVATVGDITDNYMGTTSETTAQWNRAAADYDPLFTASIPFGVVPGNHDVDFAAGGTYDASDPNHNQTDFPTHPLYYTNFGRTVWVNKGTTYNKIGYPNPSSNQNHIDLINMGPDIGNVAVVYLRWQHWQADADDAINWAYDKLYVDPATAPTYSGLKKIFVTHYVVENPGTSPVGSDGKTDWGQQGYWAGHEFSQSSKIYAKFKSDPNFFMMLGGHVGGEGWRQDTYNGATVKTFSTDYSGCSYPAGVLRTMKFSKINDRIEFKSFVPSGSVVSSFTRPWLHGFTTTRTNDYDNNSSSQWTFFTQGTGIWKVQGMADVTYGTAAGDIPVPGDYDADGKTDIAIFRSGGTWKRKDISPDVALGVASEDVPVPGDYDGNGSTDCAIYRPSSHTFYVSQSYLSSNVSTVCGTSSTNDVPVAADYSGDGKVDCAVFNKSTAVWTIIGGANGQYGYGGDIPVPGDYNGTGKNIRSVYRPSENKWYKEGTSGGILLGVTGDIPAPGDYDGDGKTDMAVYTPTGTGAGNLKYISSSSGSTVTIATGVTGGKPLNLPYHIRKYFF